MNKGFINEPEALAQRIAEIRLDKDHKGDPTNPKAADAAHALATHLAGLGVTLPNWNISATDDGDILFSLFGLKERRADIWIEKGGTVFTMIKWRLDEATKSESSPVTTTGLQALAKWLKGE